MAKNTGTLVNMIKEGCENEIGIVDPFELLFKKAHKFNHKSLKSRVWKVQTTFI